MAELFYNRIGQGEPLLILHGLFGSSRNWQTLARRYAERYEVISVDLRNHGQSFHAPQMDYAVMAKDISQLVSHLGLSDCRLIGHSMGGKVALRLAIDQPELLQRIVVVDIAPVAYQHDHHSTLEALLSVDIDKISSRAEADNQLQAHIPEAPLRAFLLQNLVRQEDRWQWRVNLDAIKNNMAELTGFDLPAGQSITLPSLFVYGTRSDYVGEAEQAIIRSQFAQASLLPVSETGHWVHAEKPELFLQLTLDYLAA